MARTNEQDVQQALASTDWLPCNSAEDLNWHYTDYRKRAGEVEHDITELLGPPRWRYKEDRTWFGTWYPEAFAGAVWWYADRWLCLAAEHADRETPVILQLRLITEAALNALTREAGDVEGSG
jgi:hypothetical protein